MAYHPVNGNIYANGGNYKAANITPVGSVIEMIVDTIKWTITWVINKQESISSSINPQMRNSPLFVYISLLQIGSIVELSK